MSYLFLSLIRVSKRLEICDMLTRSGAVDVIVVDSVAALTPKAEIEGDMGDSHMGLASTYAVTSNAQA